jgi:hypothetical protein
MGNEERFGQGNLGQGGQSGKIIQVEGDLAKGILVRETPVRENPVKAILDLAKIGRSGWPAARHPPAIQQMV